MNPKLRKWQCIACGYLLGWVEDGKIVRMKRKDFYIEIEGGRVATNCIRCGKKSEIVDSQGKEVTLHGLQRSDV